MSDDFRGAIQIIQILILKCTFRAQIAPNSLFGRLCLRPRWGSSRHSSRSPSRLGTVGITSPLDAFYNLGALGISHHNAFGALLSGRALVLWIVNSAPRTTSAMCL